MSATSTPDVRVEASPSPKAAHRREWQSRYALFFGGALLASIALAVLFGVEPTSLTRAISEPASLDRLLIWKARLPRVLLAATAGAGLSTVGAALQSLLRNPLAEPYLLGVSGGAALGATLAILAGLSGLTFLGAAFVPLAALVGGLMATILVYSLARQSGGVSGTEILLSGIIVNAIAAALVTFAKTLGTAARTQELLFWLVGFVDVPSPLALSFVGIYVLVGALLLWLDAGRLNLLALGEESASHLGLDVRALVRRVFFAASLVVGAIVSTTGLIGFVGLIVPHAVRRLLGPDLRRVIPASCLGGATVMVLSDLLARASFRWIGSEPPVGAVTALLGGPVALVLLRHTRAMKT